MYTSEPDSRWALALVPFIEIIGVQATPQQLHIIDLWLQKHNVKLHDAAVELERANSRSQRLFVSLN